jgi:hypothetical protein
MGSYAAAMNLRSFSVVLLALGCGGTTTTIGDDGGSDAAPMMDGAAADVTVDVSVDVHDASNTTCNAQVVNLSFDNCPATPMCGGTIADGVYDYTAGCIPSPWGAFQMQCPALQVTGQMGTVQGCATYMSGSLTQVLSTSYSATLGVPAQCLFNATCMQLQTQLANYFTTVMCTAATTGCDCAVALTTNASDTVSYMTSNNQIVTSTNDHYNYCVQGTSLTTEFASGPNPSSGVYSATHQ